MRERTRVTMVTRLCARVKHSGLFRIEKSLCWLGNPSEPLAVTDWISNFKRVIVHVLDHGPYSKLTCASARGWPWSPACVRA